MQTLNLNLNVKHNGQLQRLQSAYSNSHIPLQRPTIPLKRPFPFAPITTPAKWLSPRIRVFPGRNLYLGTRTIATGMLVGTSRKPLNEYVYVKRHNVPYCRRSVRLFVLCFRRSTPCVSSRYPLYTRTSRAGNVTCLWYRTHVLLCSIMKKLCRQDSRPIHAPTLAIYVLPKGRRPEATQRDATRVARTLKTEYQLCEDFMETLKRC